jgi:hypothetical protein
LKLIPDGSRMLVIVHEEEPGSREARIATYDASHAELRQLRNIIDTILGE